MRMRFGAVLLVLPSLALAAGELDPGFGTGGTVLSTTQVTDVGGVGLQPDGRIVVAAAATGGDGSPELLLVRYAGDGTADETFGNAGSVAEPIGIAFRPALVVEPDGSLVVAATRCTASDCVAILHRYDAGGHADPTFTAADRLVDSPTYAEVVVRQDDGRLVVGGNAGHAPAFVVWLARYGADGTDDGTFGNGGLVTVPISSHGASLGSLVATPDGALLAGVTGGTIEGVFSSIARFTTSGAAGGERSTSFNDPLLALAPDGSIAAAGTLGNFPSPTSAMAVARFGADLAPDPTFGGGTVTGPAAAANEVLAEADGGMVVATALGDAGGGSRFACVRWTTAGSLDAGFGQGGVAAAFPGTTGNARRLLRQPDGKLVVAGFVGGAAGGSLALARFVDDAASTTITTSTTSTSTAMLPATTTTNASSPRTRPSTTTTTLAGSTASCVADVGCDDGDACTTDRCDAGRCVHEPRSGFEAVTCLCGSPMPTCSDGAAPVDARVRRACDLVASAPDLRVRRARRVVRRALHLLRGAARRMTRIERTATARCLGDVSGRVAELERRVVGLLAELH